MNLNQFEVDVLLVTLNAKTAGFCKDMRLMNAIEEKLKAAKVTYPTFLKIEGEAPADMEERFANHNKKCEDLANNEVEVVFNATETQVLCGKLLAFNDFSTEKVVRDKVILLMDKLGL